MPSLLSPTSSSSARAYTPLADEVNPSFGNIAPSPTVTRNGTIVYSKRSVSSTSSSSSKPDDRDPERLGVYRTESEETLSPSASQKGKGRAMNGHENGYGVQEEDIGEMRRGETLKGKEKAWDEEMGKVEVGGGRYPPVNEAEDEERKIQENLAKFAARDMARRRAARLSRQLPSSPPLPSSPGSSSSTTTGFMRRPFSMISTLSSGDKRNSIMGLMEGIMGSPKPKTGWADGELPMTISPHDAHDPSRPYNNPYDASPASPRGPQMVISPTSPTPASPFADPAPAKPPPPALDPSHRRDSMASNSTATPSPLHSPTDGQGFTYGYAGPSWRGGNVAQSDEPPRGGEKWWHALCAWGSDLDGGHDVQEGSDGQAGRTNPFE